MSSLNTAPVNQGQDANRRREMKVADYLDQYRTLHTHDEIVAIEYSGIVRLTPAQALERMGIEADFSRPDGLSLADGCGDPVSVVYRVGSNRYIREMEMVSYTGVYCSRGPFGGIHVHPQQPVEVVITR